MDSDSPASHLWVCGVSHDGGYQGLFLFVMTLPRYEIYADEAWTHGNLPLKRYWCFYGGVFGPAPELDKLDTRLRAVKARHCITGEIKWNKITSSLLPCYMDFVDCLLDSVEAGDIRFRQMFCDRAFVRVPDAGELPASDLDIQFKLCYQFLKHCFGLRYMPSGLTNEVLVRLDTHSSQKHKDRLEDFARGIPAQMGRSDFTVRVTFDDSRDVPRIQVADLMIGASGSYGNNMHEMRAVGKRGMNDKQRARLALCKHIYNRIREIDAKSRGKLAFNWFESTGFDGDPANMFHHKLRIWKFIPKRFRTDEGWQNKNLDKHGQYIAPQVDDLVRAADGSEALDMSQI